MAIWVRASLAGIGVTVTNPRSVHRNRTDPSLHLARGLITMAHHPAVPILVRKIGMRGNKSFDLRLERFGPQPARPRPQHMRQGIGVNVRRRITHKVTPGGGGV